MRLLKEKNILRIKRLLTKHGFKYTLFNTRLGPLDLLHGELPGLHAAPGSVAFSDKTFTFSSLANGNKFGNTRNILHILIHCNGPGNATVM